MLYDYTKDSININGQTIWHYTFSEERFWSSPVEALIVSPLAEADYTQILFMPIYGHVDKPETSPGCQLEPA